MKDLETLLKFTWRRNLCYYSPSSPCRTSSREKERRGPLLCLLAGVSVPGRHKTKNSANNTWHRFRFQHTACLRAQVLPFHRQGPNVKAGSKGNSAGSFWRFWLQEAQGSQQKQHRMGEQLGDPNQPSTFKSVI